MHTKRLTITYVALAAALLGLFALNLFWGSVAISPRGVVQALLGRGQDELAANILLQLRLPRAVMVVLLGAALSVAGYLLQTFFANPIAGPFVMGISSGAKLVVALTMVVFLNHGLLTNSLTLILAAFAGSMAAMAFTASTVSLASAGQMTVMLGTARNTARSSTHWWVAPSPKSDRPDEEPQIFTFSFPIAMVWRIWS